MADQLHKCFLPLPSLKPCLVGCSACTVSKQLPNLAAPFKIPSLACFIARQTVLFSAAAHPMMCPKLMPSPASAKLYPSSCLDIPAVFSIRLSSCRVFQLAYYLAAISPSLLPSSTTVTASSAPPSLYPSFCSLLLVGLCANVLVPRVQTVDTVPGLQFFLM